MGTSFFNFKGFEFFLTNVMLVPLLTLTCITVHLGFSFIKRFHKSLIIYVIYLVGKSNCVMRYSTAVK